MNYLQPMLIFIVSSTIIAFSLYAIGRWIQPRLRARGYGKTLDSIDNWHARMSRMGVLHSLHAIRALHILPLYGTRRQREAIDTMIDQAHQKTDPARRDTHG